MTHRPTSALRSTLRPMAAASRAVADQAPGFVERAAFVGVLVLILLLAGPLFASGPV